MMEREDTTTETAGARNDADDATSSSEHVMDMLGEHLPLSLLMDLTSPKGPDSTHICDVEGLPADSWWTAVELSDEESAGPDGGRTA